ncbi:MAG TPA: signal peptidase I [Bacillota bacterium]
MNIKRIVKKVYHFLTNVLFMLLVTMLIIVLFFRISGEDPNILGYQLKMVMSGSMEPDIKTGSIITIKLEDETTQFKKGDVITYITKEKNLMTHRIVEVGNDGQFYITKGDRNNGPDAEPVLHQNVIGKYTGFTIPYVGYAANFIQSKQGIMFLIIVPGLLFILYALLIFGRILQQLNRLADKGK